MQVIAKYQIAYRGKLYLCGQVFELDKNDFEKYKNDINLLVQMPRSLSTKPLSSTLNVKAIKPKLNKKAK